VIGRVLLAVASGVLQFLSFAPVRWWWAAPVGVAALVLAVRRQTGGRAAALGLVAGWAFFLPLLHWLSVLGPDAWLVLAVVISGWFAAMGYAVAVVQDLRWWVVAVPAVWVLQEWARSRFPWGGLGWGRLAFGQPDSPLTGWVTLAGAPGLTYIVALCGCLLVAAAASLRSAATAVTVLVVGGLVGVLVNPETGAQGPPRTAQLAVVQGNVQKPGIDFLGRPLSVLTNHQRTTLELAAKVDAGEEPQPDAVIWPENSSDLDPTLRADAKALIDSAAQGIGAPILVGTVQSVPGRPDRAANVGIVWEPGVGPTDAYVKQHPVPFGEFLPFRSVLSRFISRFDRVPRDFIAGQEPGVLTIGPARIADVICFEVSNDEIVLTGVREGGRALVVQTNNATYATTAQPEQQFDISRLRARETGRTVLVAATTGVTAVIEPDGMFTTVPQLTSAWINSRVVLSDTRTPAVAYGGVVQGVLAVLGLAALLAGIRVRRRRATDAQ
jgi:apolipoprotein N-acyltransferase